MTCAKNQDALRVGCVDTRMPGKKITFPRKVGVRPTCCQQRAGDSMTMGALGSSLLVTLKAGMPASSSITCHSVLHFARQSSFARQLPTTTPPLAGSTQRAHSPAKAPSEAVFESQTNSKAQGIASGLRRPSPARSLHVSGSSSDAHGVNHSNEQIADLAVIRALALLLHRWEGASRAESFGPVEIAVCILPPLPSLHLANLLDHTSMPDLQPCSMFRR
jgi:hypothetical protein